MKLLAFGLLLRILVLLPTPPRQPDWVCGDCGASNNAMSTRCRNCQYPPADAPRPTADEDD